MIDFSGFRAFRTSSLSGGLGNLRHQLSPFEALGIWPTSEFRLAASDSSHPAAFYLGGLIALAALAVGLPRWLRRYGPAVPAALAAAIFGYLGARLFGTVYTSAKTLAIAAPMVTLVAFGGLLSGGRPARRGWVMPGLAAVLAAAMALSSLLVLRQTPVAPTDHANQLAEFRPLVQGQKVLFLGRDNFIAYELRGPAARRVHDRKPTRHRLDHDARARVLHLRVQQEVRAAHDVWRLALGVAADKVDPAAQVELVDERSGRRDETAGDEQAREGLGLEHASERAQPELEPVGLGLVSSEQQHGSVRQRFRCRREVIHVDGVVQDLPAAGRRTQELVGRGLREPALIEDVRRGT